MQRHTSYMLVILKHEKPIKDLPDLVADRLSKMEGVDGSGVAVSMFDAQAGKDFIVRAEALEDARYRGDAVEAIAAQRATPFPIGYDFTEPEVMIKVTNYGTPSPMLAHPTDEERAALSAAIKKTVVVNRAVDAMSPEQLDKYARMLADGIGENLI